MNIDEQRIFSLRIERHDENWWSVHVEDAREQGKATCSAESLSVAMYGALRAIEFILQHG